MSRSSTLRSMQSSPSSTSPRSRADASSRTEPSCQLASGELRQNGETFSPVVSLFSDTKAWISRNRPNSPKSAEIRRRAAARAVNSRRAEAALAENGRKGAGRPCNRVGRPKPSEWVGTIVRTSDERGPLEVSSVALGCAPRCILQWRRSLYCHQHLIDTDFRVTVFTTFPPRPSQPTQATTVRRRTSHDEAAAARAALLDILCRFSKRSFECLRGTPCRAFASSALLLHLEA